MEVRLRNEMDTRILPLCESPEKMYDSLRRIYVIPSVQETLIRDLNREIARSLCRTDGERFDVDATRHLPKDVINEHLRIVSLANQFDFIGEFRFLGAGYDQIVFGRVPPR